MANKNEVIDKYLDIAEDIKKFAEILENSGKSKLQVIITLAVDITVYIVVKKYARTLQLIKFDKKCDAQKKLGKSILDEVSFLEDDMGKIIDDIYKKYFKDKKNKSNITVNANKITLKENIKKSTIVEFLDKNSILVKTNDEKRVLIHKTKDNKEKRYILNKEGNLETYEIKNEKGEYQKYENNSLDKINKKDIKNLSNTLNNTTFNKIKLQNSIKNIDKSNLEKPSEIGIVLLKKVQTISHIVQNTKFNLIELLEYNNLSQEESKNLPVGYKILFPKEPPLEIEGEYGRLKLFKNHNNTFTLIIPDENYNRTYSADNNLSIYGDKSNPNKISFINKGVLQVWEKDDKGIMYLKKVSTEEFDILYKMQENKKVLKNVEIKVDNLDVEKIAKYLEYLKE
ncbi:hypothetical protein CRU99_13460 [Malaciobacter mytili]|uniref:hypothetical protein n=1 Tax=Malaciobacter mytili TaxID=603050 RepID=UPI00100BD234|nr:hypothetical protein [Malaciobacter mytili]RXI36293.1 hypothetical protein CRU99_13460 [Malaciobacter mytili]